MWTVNVGLKNAHADMDFFSAKNLAINAITGGKVKPQNQSGLGSLASSFLGGQSSHGGGGSSGGGGGGGIGGPIGHLVGSLFTDKPNSQNQQSHSNQQSSGYGGSGSAGGQQGGGMMGFFGGHHGSSVSTADREPHITLLMCVEQLEQQFWLLVYRSRVEWRILRASSSGYL